MVLVRKTAWKGKHKIQDRWESDEYQVIEQPTSGIPVYKVQCVAGGRTRILHRNLFLPLQGKTRQPGGLEMKDLPSPEEEYEEDGMPGVTKTPQVKFRRMNTTPQSSPTQQEKATKEDAFADLKSKVSSDFRQLSDRLDTDENSGEEELYTGSVTSHTTETDSTTIRNLSSPVGPILSRVEEPSTFSQTESQFSPNMPYLEETLQSDNSRTEDSVFTSHSNNVDDTNMKAK